MANQEKAATPAKRAFKRGKAVVLPILKLAVDKPVIIKVLAPIHESRPSVDKKTGELKTVDLMSVQYFADDDPNKPEDKQIVVGAVLKSILTEEYENDAYVGKIFELNKEAKRGEGANGYHPYTLYELEL